MKTILFVGDGMADEPQESLGGLTPLEYAKTPNIDALAGSSFIGQVQTVFEGLPCGSDIANLTLLGYDPHNLPPVGRGPIEAVSQGVDVSDTAVAYRCNLVTIENGILTDYSAGGIQSERSHLILDALADAFNHDPFRFYPGVDYRHLLILDPGDPDIHCSPPHDHMGEAAEPLLPCDGEDADKLTELIHASRDVISSLVKKEGWNDCRASSIWPWGQGQRLCLPSFEEKYHSNGAVISGVDLVRGIGRLAGLEMITVPGATGRDDTDYAAKMRYGLKVLEKDDFLFLHVEAPDEAGHHGDALEKVKTIEDIDREMFGPLLEILDKEKFRLLFLPDHATPVRVRTHVYDPVPYLLYPCPTDLAPNGLFNETTGRESGVYEREGWKLIERLFR